MDLKEIKTIIDLMSKNNLAEFDLEREGFKIRLKRSLGEPSPSIHSPSPIPISSMPISIPVVSPAGVGATSISGGTSETPGVISSASSSEGATREIVSPMVGTLYRSPSPDSPPYVEVGQPVTEETVVCIIEAMKVMNEIKAEMRGIITEILAENGKPVEFGKPLFRVKAN